MECIKSFFDFEITIAYQKGITSYIYAILLSVKSSHKKS